MSLSNSGKPSPVTEDNGKQLGGERIITFGGVVFGTDTAPFESLLVGFHFVTLIKDRIASGCILWFADDINQALHQYLDPQQRDHSFQVPK